MLPRHGRGEFDDAMRVTCVCGSRLRARPEWSGKHVRCPACGASVLVPLPSTTEDGGVSGPAPMDLLDRLSRGDKNTPTSRPAQSPPVIRTDVPEDEPLYGLSDGDHIPIETLHTPGQIPEVEAAGYAVNESIARARRRVAERDVIQGPKRGFWQDLAFAFVYPVASVENAVTTVVLTLFVLMAIVCRFAGGYGALGRLAVFGWLAAACMTVVEETTIGNDEMPGVKMEGGWVEDVLIPAFKYVATYVIAMVPLFVYLMACHYQWITDRRGIILCMWVGLGIFLWPLIMLLGALGEWRILLQPHLIVLTIAQSVLPYLAIWLVLLLSQALWIASNFWWLLLAYGIDVRGWMPTLFTMEWLIFLFVSEIVLTYLTLVSMRLVGLYYLHFKQRFAFKLE